jgi:hypothetical protein
VSLPDLTSNKTYMESCLQIAVQRLSDFESMDDIAAHQQEINQYERLDHLSEPQDIYELDADAIPPADLDRARKAVLDGRVFWEHTAAGEATRLKLGTKYLINPAVDLMPLKKIAARWSEDQGRDVSVYEIEKALTVTPDRLLPLTLGQRHMLQHSYDLLFLAREAGLKPTEVLAKQHCLVILNEQSADDVLKQTVDAHFHGLQRKNCLFMVQKAFPGIEFKGGRFRFDPESPKRLHNHGQLVMQETMDDQIFRLDAQGNREYLKAEEFEAILETMLCKISYNIEDLTYLTGSIYWAALSQALALGEKGYDMVMEIVANDPENPIKGGMAAYDSLLNRNVMIESFQLSGMPNEDITHLNKNFNHYTNPVKSWRAVKEKKLPMPIVVKNGFLYYQPVQGDINFLVNTAFVRRKDFKPIRAWKSPSNTVSALNAMHDQDNQPEFRKFAEKVLGKERLGG